MWINDLQGVSYVRGAIQGVHLGIQAPRLYRKDTGVFFVRAPVDPVHLGAAPEIAERPNKRELKRSLRTKNPKVARSISSYLNALVESVATEQREAVVNQFIAHTISTWTLPGGVSCDDDDDQARLERLFTKFPRIEKAVAKCIARAAPAASDGTAMAPHAHTPATDPISDAKAQAVVVPEPQSPPVSPPTSAAQPEHAATDSRQHAPPAATATALLPMRPMHLAAARTLYDEHYSRTLETQKYRTAGDKVRLLDMFVDYLRVNHPELGDDPWVHTIDAALLHTAID